MDQNNYQQPVQQTSAQPNLLVFGILSRVFTSIVGSILGAIGRKKGKAYIAQGGELTGGSKVGFILCKVGIILGIVATIVIIIYAIIAAVTGAALNNLASQINY